MTRIDMEFVHLQEIVDTLDTLLDGVQGDIAESDDPDGDGTIDRGEALVGLGFVALQNYLVARKGQRSKDVYDTGPAHNSGLHIARIVNEGANYWKHRHEWPDEFELKPFQQVTAQVLMDVGVWDHDYKLVNLLGALSPGMSFATIVADLDRWRERLDPGGFIP